MFGDIALPPLSEEQHLHTPRHKSGLSGTRSDFEKSTKFWKSPHFGEKLAFEAGPARDLTERI
jgi:hypothetical protein